MELMLDESFVLNDESDSCNGKEAKNPYTPGCKKCISTLTCGGTANVVSLGVATANAPNNDGMTCRTVDGSVPHLPFATCVAAT